MVKIKCCGMTNLDDCKLAEELGVDFVGFVFYKRSTRWVRPGVVRQITRQLDEAICTVGVFVEENDREIEHILDYCRLDFAQVYRESALPNTIRAFRIGRALAEPIPAEGLCLFDSYSEGFGGSGMSFDHGLLPRERAVLGRSFIAGGLDAYNVEAALRLEPFGIDLVSSLEEYPGKKDPEKMERFVRTVRSLSK